MVATMLLMANVSVHDAPSADKIELKKKYAALRRKYYASTHNSTTIIERVQALKYFDSDKHVKFNYLIV